MSDRRHRTSSGACDIRIASENATFAQIEIKRGIFPFGGATLRFPEIAGWGNAMRWLLTGDEFDANEAFRIGLIQEVTAHGKQIEKAVEIAETISKQAPLGVRATIESARKMQSEGFEKAKDYLNAADSFPLCIRRRERRRAVVSRTPRRKF